MSELKVTTEVCPHGSLKRQCLVCERDDEIAALRQQLAEARALMIHADSMLSAYGHGRVITKDEALALSGQLRDFTDRRGKEAK